MTLRLHHPGSPQRRVAILLFVAAIVPSLSAQSSNRALFNGKDLAGWQQVGPGNFVVKDGMMKTEGGMGMLWYATKRSGMPGFGLYSSSRGRKRTRVFSSASQRNRLSRGCR